MPQDQMAQDLAAEITRLQDDCQPDGFIVVSKFMLPRPPVPPRAYHYDYSHYSARSDAEEHYRDLQNGEYEGWEAHAILTCRRGLPTGALK